MTRSRSAMHAYYAARAPYYDAVYLKPERRNDISALIEYLPERFAGRAVLEVACGTGYWTPHIAKAARSVVATDGTAEPLEFARLRPGCESVRFELIDAYALPARLGQFDGVFAGLWFSHIPIAARKSFLSGLHNRLLPGSRVVFLDNNEVQQREFPIAESDLDGNTYQHRTLRDGTVHRVLKNFPSAAELRELLGQYASRIQYKPLENFWMLEYEVAGQA